MLRRRRNASSQVLVTGTEGLETEIKQFSLTEFPASCSLTPNELYLLEQSGFQPIQVVFGTLVYSMGVGGVLRTIKRALSRGELPDFTKMIQDSRILARNRMLDEARKVGADLVVGVHFSVSAYADFVEVVCAGTAVKKKGERAEVTISIGA